MHTDGVVRKYFVGDWVGEPLCPNAPTLRWHINQIDDTLRISMQREDTPGEQRQLMAVVSVEGRRFWVAVGAGVASEATLLDDDHFVLPAFWPHFGGLLDDAAEADIVFSRPGLAELTAHTALRGKANGRA
jgi:hypothetical protein